MELSTHADNLLCQLGKSHTSGNGYGKALGFRFHRVENRAYLAAGRFGGVSHFLKLTADTLPRLLQGGGVKRYLEVYLSVVEVHSRALLLEYKFLFAVFHRVVLGIVHIL